jgi:hypothetical protein
MSQHTRIAAALAVIHQYGGTDGAHHKQWVLDQVVRELTGPDYAEWIHRFEWPEHHDEALNAWDEGIAP